MVVASGGVDLLEAKKGKKEGFFDVVSPDRVCFNWPGLRCLFGDDGAPSIQKGNNWACNVEVVLGARNL